MTEPSSPQSEFDQPELAFEAMAQRLAGLTAAMDGFAARQQELHGRDYAPDLEKIQENFESVSRAINALAKKPALTLTPDDVAEQIESAGRSGRQADHYAWDKAQSRLAEAARSIETVVASALQARVQRYRMAGASAATFMAGMILAYCCSGAIDRMVPEDWHWPEASAAKMLGLSEWDAGARLMQVADPREWQQTVRASATFRYNARAIAECDAYAAKIKGPVQCQIEINP